MKPTYRKSWVRNLLMCSDFQTRIAKFKSSYNSRIIGQGQTWIAKVKSTCNSLIIGPIGLQCETSL